MILRNIASNKALLSDRVEFQALAGCNKINIKI